jgi:hypothetical protein
MPKAGIMIDRHRTIEIGRAKFTQVNYRFTAFKVID